LNVAGQDKRIVFQGVHMLMGADLGTPWRSDERRESRMVFIGRDLPKDVLLQGLQQSVN
jgi:G3E family GTPase